MVSWQAFPSLPSRAPPSVSVSPCLPRMLATLNLSMQAEGGDQIVEP